VFSMDAKGCGRSAGTRAFVRNFEHLVRSYVTYFSKIKEEFPGKKAVLMGESMGGAIAIQIHRQHPELDVAGAILVAPMCRIADEIRPPAFVISVCQVLAKLVPTAPIIPSDGVVRICCRSNPCRYSCPLLLGPCPLWLVQSESLFL